MKFIKKNKFTIIAIICFLAVMLVAVEVKNIFFPSEGGAIYGDRLDGRDEVKPTNKEISKITDALNEQEAVKEAKVVIKGKIINVLMTIDDEVSLEDAKGLANIVLNKLKKDQKEYFDVQVIIDKSNDSAQFPIIGYKHHSKEGFIFTKDREEQAEQTEAES